MIKGLKVALFVLVLLLASQTANAVRHRPWAEVVLHVEVTTGLE